MRKFVIKVQNNVGVGFIKELTLNNVKKTGQIIINTTDKVEEALRFSDETYASSMVLTLMPIIQDKSTKLSLEEIDDEN